MQQVFLTVDLGFGDAGKGSIVDFLTHAYGAHTVVRYNGGAQAGHRVVTADAPPREHVFSQFGSGTFGGADTYLSRFMLLEPLAMLEEEQHLHGLGVTDAFQRTIIDERALVITPFQRAINRLKELARGDQRHGSCGMGIGETMADFLAHGERVLFAGDLTNADSLYTKLAFLQTVNLAKLQVLAPMLPDNEHTALEQAWLLDNDWAGWLIDAYRAFAQRPRIVAGDALPAILQRPGTVIFEAAQGVLLDEWAGFHPYTTWSTTTLANADQLLAEAHYSGQVCRVGITRAYTTRHGAGPLVTEDATLTQLLPDPCNQFGAWQQGFRIGWLDLVLLRYAMEIVGPLDYLALTCVDRLAELPSIHYCNRYQHATAPLNRLQPSPTPRSLLYQEQLTHTLMHCRPILETVPDANALIELLQQELRIPVGLVSEGPTWRDKRFMPVVAPFPTPAPRVRQ